MRRETPILGIDLPPWLYAKTKHFEGLTGLVVYRSIQCCRDDSPQYSPVRDLLESSRHTLLDRREMLDRSGDMFALCELSLYALEVVDLASERADSVLSGLRSECARFLQWEKVN